MFRGNSSLYVFSLFLTLLSFVTEIYGGSPCPSRTSIHPCMCTTIQKSRKSVYTMVICSHMSSTNELSKAFHSLKRMHIDRMIIVDSFLQVNENYGKEPDQHQTLPQNWVSHLRIKEMEIVDSQLSLCFACEFSDICRNDFQTHLSIINSSQFDKICTVCQVENRMKFSWIACLSHLKYFDFKQNKIEVVDRNFFPVLMKDLLVVNMSSNALRKLDRGVFRNLPKLTKLDLSHNSIRDLSEDIFGDAKTDLKFLDLSWNEILTISPGVLKLTPSLQFLNLQSNLIKKVEENVWKYMSPQMRMLNLSDNHIKCDCCLSWFNASLNTWTVVQGFCFSPEVYSATSIRRASRLLTKQCANETYSSGDC